MLLLMGILSHGSAQKLEIMKMFSECMEPLIIMEWTTLTDIIFNI